MPKQKKKQKQNVILKIKVMKSYYHIIFLFFFILTLPGNHYFDETWNTRKLFQIIIIKGLVEDYIPKKWLYI